MQIKHRIKTTKFEEVEELRHREVVQEIQEHSLVNLLESAMRVCSTAKPPADGLNHHQQHPKNGAQQMLNFSTLFNDPNAFQYASPLEQMARKIRFSRIALIMPRLLAIKPEAIREQFFPKRSYQDIAALWSC